MSELSRKMAFALRHGPGEFGLGLAPNGSIRLTWFAAAMKATVEEVKEVVNNDFKGRFAIEGHRIRAVHGHSIAVEAQRAASVAPEWLYHGTKSKNVESIINHGLMRMERQHVHLSSSAARAFERGPLVIQVRSQGIEGLHMASNGIWLAPWVSSDNLYFF
jgi:putative RNA 2'-phosphotransferase